MNRFLSPVGGLWGRLLEALSNCSHLRAARRAILGRLPFPVLASDVRDVIYAHWVVPVERVAHMVPDGVTLWQKDGRTILTILTYRHGHFGPALLGPLRRFFPSPLQSNWRLYLASAQGEDGPSTILFIRNIFDSALYAIGTRLFSDVLPSHWCKSFGFDVEVEDIRIHLQGPGSSPGFALDAQATNDHVLPADFASLFTSWENATRFLCLQDGAIAAVEDCGRLAYSQISLPIDMATIQPLVAIHCTGNGALGPWGADQLPFCFRVPAVPFRVLSERLLPYPDRVTAR